MIQYEYEDEECPRCFRLIVCRAVDTMARVAVGHVEPESVEIIQPRTYKPCLAGPGCKTH